MLIKNMYSQIAFVVRPVLANPANELFFLLAFDFLVSLQVPSQRVRFEAPFTIEDPSRLHI